MTWNSINYNQNDLMRMQQDAVNRVREMQRRASQYAGPNNTPNNHTPTPEAYNQHFNQQTNQNNTNNQPQIPPNQATQNRTPQPNLNQNHNNPNNSTHHNNAPMNPIASLMQSSPLGNIQGILSNFNLDNDRLIILALAFILFREGVDNLLLLALVYIFLS